MIFWAILYLQSDPVAYSDHYGTFLKDPVKEQFNKAREFVPPKPQEINSPPKVLRHNGLPEWKWQIVEIVKQYDWDWRVASAVFYAESGLNSTSLGDGSSSCGIAQLHPCPTNINWQDPHQNIDYAYKYKYKPSGFYPWTVYKTGKYKQYLYLFH